TEGLICVLTAVEPCGSYDIRCEKESGKGNKLKLVHAPRKCQHLYHYYVHPAFGFMHVRLQTRLPFNLFPCVNGREWLGRRMDAAGIGYVRRDNCFTRGGDPEAAPPALEGEVAGDIKRRAEVSRACNRRYLEAAAAVQTPTPLKTLTESLGRAATWKGRRVRGLNLLGDDAALLEALAGGEFLIHGLRNRDL